METSESTVVYELLLSRCLQTPQRGVAGVECTLQNDSFSVNSLNDISELVAQWRSGTLKPTPKAICWDKVRNYWRTTNFSSGEISSHVIISFKHKNFSFVPDTDLQDNKG